MYIHYHMCVNIIHIVVVNSEYILINQADTTPVQFVVICGENGLFTNCAHTCHFAHAKRFPLKKLLVKFITILWIPQSHRPSPVQVHVSTINTSIKKIQTESTIKIVIKKINQQ